MPRTLSSVIRTALNLTCSSRARRRKPVARASANPGEVLETRQVLSAVSLGVIDGTTFKLDTNAAGDSSAAANSTEIDLIFGQPGDLILTGDWNGQGSTAVAVRQPGQNGAPNDGLIHRPLGERRIQNKGLQKTSARHSYTPFPESAK